MAPLVSVCLPLFNGEDFVAEAIESVLAQTHRELELIVIDDGSSDSSQSIAGSYARKYTRIRLFANEKRRGLFGNYNECFQKCNGTFIKPFAQDDVLKPTAIERLLELTSLGKNIALAGCVREWIDRHGNQLPDNLAQPSAAVWQHSFEALSRDFVIDRSTFPLVNFIGEPSAVLFPAHVLGEGFSTDYSHIGDFEYWLRLLRSGDFVCTDEVLCSIRHHDRQQTLKNFEDLSVATDVFSLAREVAGSIERKGATRDDFVTDALISVASKLNSLVSDGQLPSADARASSEGSQPVFELAFRSLMLLGQASRSTAPRFGPYKKVYYNERHIRRLETYLHRLMVDPGWRSTRVLREVNALWRRTDPGAQESDLNIATAHNDFMRRTRKRSANQIVESQDLYLGYLRSMIGRVRQSRSWDLRRRVCSFLPPLQAVSGETSALERCLTRLPRNLGSVGRRTERVATPSEHLIKQVCFERYRSAAVPRISVLVSVEYESIRNTLTTIARQSLGFDDFEVIIVDGFELSTFRDELETILHDLPADLQLRVFQTSARGRAAAHNLAVQMARSELIVFLAGDFAVQRDFLERHLQFHQARSAPEVIGIGAGIFPPELQKTDFMRWLDKSGSLFGVSFTGEKRELPPNFFYVANSSLKKQAIIDAGYFDERFPFDAWDDYEMGLRLFAMGMRSEFVDGAGCEHFHVQTLDSRRSALRIAGASACILDSVRTGSKSWHRDVARGIAGNRTRALLSQVCGVLNPGKDRQHRYYKDALTLSFVEGYLEKWEELGANQPPLTK